MRSEERRVGKERRQRRTENREYKNISRAGEEDSSPRPKQRDIACTVLHAPAGRKQPARTNYLLFFFKQKTAYELGLGIPAEPLFRSQTSLGQFIGLLNTTRKLA